LVMNRIIQFFKGFDWILFVSVIFLVIIGITEIYSVALGQATPEAIINFKKQIGFFAIGLILLFIFAYLISYEFLKNNAIFIFLGGVILLILVLLFGSEVRGTKSWFSIGFFGIQPVEFIKLILLIFVARYLSILEENKIDLKSFLITGLGAALLIGLVLAQPDFGSAVILLATWALLVMISGLKKRYIFGLIVILIAVSLVSWTFYFKPYQKQRVLTFLNASDNSLSQGYNVSQAIIAIGSGQLYGRGIGFGSQSQLKFLPESQNDFIFAVMAEELGFIGIMLVLGLFLTFFTRCYINLRKIDDRFGFFVILGCAILIFIEMFINIGMNLGIVPVVGISLPFISYGGSGMIANLVLVGIIESIVIKARRRGSLLSVT
ncbi:MAG: rod shape-determining protein RodA, partial [Candidatus Falkowbacteria bacterium]|nr:rod shape-determining protein RodA [Candidatus Falkowbacteria bacterium]